MDPVSLHPMRAVDDAENWRFYDYNECTGFSRNLPGLGFYRIRAISESDFGLRRLGLSGIFRKRWTLGNRSFSMRFGT
jgi:hypothetical protein